MINCLYRADSLDIDIEEIIGKKVDDVMKIIDKKAYNMVKITVLKEGFIVGNLS